MELQQIHFDILDFFDDDDHEKENGYSTNHIWGEMAIHDHEEIDKALDELSEEGFLDDMIEEMTWDSYDVYYTITSKGIRYKKH